MKKKTLNKIISTVLFEADTIGMPDVAYGIYDRPGPKNESDPEFKPTVPPSVPLKPTELMSNQLAVERPPIEDDEYAPTSVSDLRKAASAIAGMVPPDKVGEFYKQSMDLLDRMEKEDMSKSVTRSVNVAAEDEETKTESRWRRRGLQALIEALEGEDMYATRTGERLRSKYDPEYSRSRFYDDDMGSYDPSMEPEEEEMAPTPSVDDDEALEQLARQFGYKGASGMRQALHKIYALMNYLITKVGADTIENMMGTAVPEFTALVKELNAPKGKRLKKGMPGNLGLEEDDVVYLMTNPRAVREMDTFRNYFNALYRPVYQKLRTEKEKEIRNEISSLGVPKDALDSVYYQITGTSARKDSTIAKKLARSMPPEEVKKTLDTVSKNFVRLKKQLDSIPNNLLDLTHDRVDAMGVEKKKRMVLDAFGETAAFREQFGESRRRRARK